MTRRTLYILFLLLVGATPLFAQTDTIRYVKTTGNYTNDGRSWTNAKSDLQSAINDLKEYLDEYGLTSGSIYVAAGTYKPTETTEAEGGGLQYTSFKVYPGIHIYGGFASDESRSEAKPYNADGTVNETYRPLDHSLSSLESGQEAKAQPWNFVNKTILSGSHYTDPTFTYEQDHGTFNTVFPGNSYHVVWFATEGFIPVTVSGEQDVHALPLSSPASVDGCRITGGYAASKATTERLHTAYGGGAYLVANATLSRCVVDHCEAVMRGGGVYLDGGGLVDKCFINTCQSPGVGIMQGYGGGVCIDYDGAVTRSYIVNNCSRIGGGVAICHAPDEYPWQSLDAWRVANGGTARGEINVYSPHATACIISNNTTSSEGGGIYFYDGGVGNHLTVTRNRCIGKDIIYYGRRHGRSGGVYVLNGGQIYNSVFWGNKCEANSDIQFASHTSGSTDDVVDPVTGEVTKEGLKPKFYYSAIEKHDITDWAGTAKQNVMSLESTNTNEDGTKANYPYFIGSDGRGKMMGYAGAGVNIDLPMGTVDTNYDPTVSNADLSVNPHNVPDPNATGIPRPIYWKPAAITSMAKKGLQVTDALHLTSKWIEHAHTENDLFLDTYEPMSTFGALTRRDEQIGCVMVPNQEIALYRDKGYTQAKVDAYNDAVVADAMNNTKVLETQLPDDGTVSTLPTIFVDPSRNAGAAGITIGQQDIGASWTYPVAHINDAIHYFRQRQWAKDTAKEFWYNIGGTSDGAGGFTGGTDYPYVQILVKGFERGSDIYATTAGLDAYLGTQLRTAAIRPASNMRIYGGYLPTCTGTDASQRNARTYPTMITANITNTGYENNSAHVLALINVKNVIIDGLRLNDGNANLNENHSYAPIDPATGNPYPINFGGGLVMNNRSVPQSERIDMTGNIMRNSYIANCSAPEGAAIYVNSSNKKGDGTYSKAELNIINTIIRNNTVGDGTHDISDPSFGDAGVITACGGEALIRIDHCDIVNNCGFALETLEYTDKTTPSTFNANGINEDEGQIRIYNSVIYANGKVDRSNRKNITHPLSCRSRSNSQNNVDGDYIFLDWDAPKPKNPAHCYATLCRDMSDQYQKWAVRKMDINQQTVMTGSTLEVYYFDTQAQAEAYIAANPAPGIDYTTGTGWEWNHAQGSSSAGPILLDYPFFENPSKNVGHSAEGDKPMNGGVVSYMPQNKNPMVNAATSASRDLWDSDNLVRTRGGDPDIGAIEDRTLPVDGAVLYVTPDGAGRRDGSSWGNAIAGNLVYRIGDSYVVDNVNGDGTNHTVTTKNNLYRGGYAVDYVYKTGSTTYVDRQTVTQKRINLTYDADGNLTDTEEAGTTTLAQSENTQTINESNTLTRQPTEFIYGEKSGASRNFYRTNLKDSQIPTVTQVNNGYKNVDIDNALAITNNRSEDFVSGLQFAVEKAAALNKGKAVADRVQVWVGNGIYEDYKGFVMRDRVEVLGGFPATKYSTPGMSERHALVSEYVPLSELNSALEEEKDQYETTLQIIDKKPFDDATWGFNSDVILYKDKDYTESGDKTITTETTVTVPVYYRRDALPAGGYSDYYEIQGGNVLTDCTDKILNPSFEQNAGTGTWNANKAGNGWSISKGSLSLKPGSGDYTAVHGAGVQNNTGGYEVYQDIYNLEEGFYRVSCQGFNQQNAVGKISLFANGEQRLLMNVSSNVSIMQDGVAQLAQGLYDNNWVDVFVGANGHLRIGVKGNYTGNGLTMFDNFRLERLSGSEVASSSTTTSKETGYVNKAFQKEYSTFRKPVLSMPDVCMTTYWPGRIVAANGSTSDSKSNEIRWELSDGIYRGKSGTGMEVYTDAHWDGFTIRNGFIYDYLANRDGGAGVRMFEGGTLENCVVVDNTVNWTVRGRGGGGYCDGRTSKVIGCFFVNNLNSGIRNATPTSSNDIDNNGGGIYLLVGTCYNSLFANNVCWGNDSRGAGIYIEQATFYNNTVAYNTCRKRDLTINTGKGTGVHQYEGVNNGATLNVFNTIFYKNTGKAIGSQNESLLSQFKNCYIQSNNGLSSTIQGKFVNCKYGTSLDNPFEKGDEAPTLNNYRLVNSSWCINKGINLDELLDTYPDKDVDFADRVQDCQIDIGAYEYDGTQEIQPGYELIAFDPEAPETRELCAVYYVDGGGSGQATGQSPDNAACRMKLQHILDAAGRLKMDLATIKAGTTLTDANRYSTQAVNLTNKVGATYEEIYMDGTEKKVRQMTVNNNKLKDVKHVIVKVAEGIYYPIRSTNQKMVTGAAEEVLPTRSLTIPHGVEVMGGYLPHGDEHPFYETFRDPLNHKTTFSGQVEDTNTGNYGRAYHVITFTNDLFGTHDLIFSKKISESETLSGENALTGIADRAVIDGIAIEDGMANGTDEEDKGGGAAVVTDFAHVRNCIIQDNEATFYGGALFLQPGALVSGCVMLNNESDYGGAVYVEEPTEASLSSLTEAQRDAAYARVYNSTIVRNTASVRGGGIWYETNIRAKGVCLWWNSSNDMNNVAGVFDTEKLMTEGNYPFAYSAVQSRRLPGVNNIELKPEADLGVRWTTNSNDDMRWRGDKPTYSSQANKDAYYYITRLSLLIRSGMPYQLYKTLRSTYPSLELRDMAGVARMREVYDENVDASETVEGHTNISYLKHMTFTPEAKDNDFIEIGARVLNNQAGAKLERPFTRLFVCSPEFVNNDKAYRLLTCADPLYSQQGSSMANPFQKLSDALDYIIKLRSSEQMSANGQMLKDIYCDTRFEVFLSGGTYYPYHNTHGVEGHARSSTFVIPEGVTVVGGLDPDVYYCQDGYNFPYLQPMAGNDILDYAGSEHPDFYHAGQTSVLTCTSNARTTFLDESNNVLTGLSDINLVAAIPKTIWENRPLADINGNNVYEPWEFQHATVLSGNTSRGFEALDNVYHVITCFADPKYVGQLPKRYDTYDETAGQTRFSGLLDVERGGTEDATSEMHRTIILSGVTVADGNARDYDHEAVTNLKQFYRGGGIMVDGSWTDGDSDSGQTNPEDKGNRNIPFYIVGSQFQNNNAIQGGAIFTNGTMNIFSCSFVQNWAQGPTAHPTQTAADKATSQGVIQYNGGGAIATNDVLRCVNSIFANNEAMLGDWSERMESTAAGWDKQGFGGAIWGGLNAEVRLMNCDIVMNQAVSYPSVFVNPVQVSAGNIADRFCSNTIYWGNKTTGVTDSRFTGITDINDDVFSYRTQAEKEAEQAGTLTDEQLNEINRRQPMFFCAYRPGFGPKPVSTPNKATVPAVPRLNVAGGEYDPHEVPFLGETGVNYFDIFHGNNNINITFENEGVNGPNFVLPSTEPGKNGYNPSANWMISRVNNLIDNGWSYMTLTSKTATGDIEFKQTPDPNNPSAYDPNTNTGGLKPETPMNPPYDGISSGPYHFYAWQQSILFKLTLMPFGDQHYMRYKNNNMTDAITNGQSNMLRISSNPLTFEEAKAYIDMGVYEYQHRNLRINQSSEIDLLWVSSNENFERGNDGYTWQTPTSNLQAAIETLLKSRNDHAKQINIIGGEYKPGAVLGDGLDRSLSFTIQTRPYNNAAFTPNTNQDYGIRSLTLRGGYDPEIPEEQGYDFTKNKVILSVEERTSTTENHLNHVVNILDAEQYTTTVSSVDGTISNISRGVAIPITFEGITFNNELADGIKDETGYKNQGGAAIYYHEQYQYDEGSGSKSSNLLKPPAKCTPTYTSVYIDPLTGDEVSSSTPGAVSAEKVSWTWDWTQSNNEPKLTLRNCTFTRNGQSVGPTVTAPTSAVRIEGGGGEALVVNSLFEHNAGDPLVAVNTKVVNSTFGLNGGHLTLTETTENGTAYHSELHNSVIWHDDQNSSTPISNEHPGTQYSIKDEGGTELTIGTSDQITYNAITGLPNAEDAKHNYGLSDVNSDVMTGPNFTNPQHGDFSLNPSKKLMNTGDNATYARFAWPNYPSSTDYLQLMQNLHPDQSTPITRTTIIRVGTEDKSVTYTIFKATDDHDLAYVDRLIGNNIDRGAFECSVHGQRVIYVNLTKTPMGTETGDSWQSAYGYGQLQKAIDAATLFADSKGTKAYVFVKGTAGTSNEEYVTVRDGVDVYGSIQNSSTMQAIPKSEVSVDGALQYTEKEIEAFINRVKAERQAMAASGTNTTHVRGVETVLDASYAQGAVIDGFVIANRATSAEPATVPAVNITAPNIVVRNSIIKDNVMTGSSLPVVNLVGGTNSSDNCLLYNTLLYGNTADTGMPLINVGSNGYVLNCTAVSNHAGETIISGNGAPGNVSNTIAVDESSTRGTMFAPYLRPNANAYTLPAFITEHQPYWYQLHEEATSYINMGVDDKSISLIDGDNAVAKLFPNFVDFSHDRDLLGNPRRLGGRVDYGCYETWRISDSRYASNLTNPKPDLTHPVADLETSDPSYNSEYGTATMVAKGDYWTGNYGGHLYPHPGSVVYAMNGGNLVFDVDASNGNAPRFTSPVRPGYVLVKDGGSIYGQGNPLRFSYVAAEKPFTAGTQYSLMSFPHDVNLEATVEVTESSGALSQTNTSNTFTPYTYDGAARAAWDYDFMADISQLWQTDISAIQNNNSQVKGTEGWLLDFGSGITNDATYRFTGWGATNGTFVYTESGAAKTVTLTQYDSHDFATNENSEPRFTKAENMGWNLKGAPLLISGYKTGGTNPDFQMNVPHVLYRTMTNTYANNSAHATYGQFYTEQSWVGATALSPGDGFLTQTAVINDTEELKFKIPMFDGATEAAVKEMLTVSFTDEDGMGDAVQMEADNKAEGFVMPYRINSDGIKWLAYNSDVPQLWLKNSDNTPFSLAAHAPREIPIPVGIRTTHEGSYTFALLDNEAADNISAVWLIDSEKHSAVNLKETAYEFDDGDLSAGPATRFFIQLGGERPEAAPQQSNNQYQVFVRDLVLHVVGTQVGDQICVYLPGGELYVSDEAVNDHWRTQLRQRGIYLVRINKEAHKVITK